jgi:hypothetical protein
MGEKQRALGLARLAGAILGETERQFSAPERDAMRAGAG